MQEKSAGAVIYRVEENKPKYLLLLYGAGHWDYVKGNVESDESEEETLLRESEEETGLIDLKIVSGFKEVINYIYTRKAKEISKDVVFFLAETSSTEVKLSSEHTSYKWLDFDKALKQITHLSSKNVLKRADKFIKSLARQKHLA